MTLALTGKLMQKTKISENNKKWEEKRHYGRKESKCNGLGADLLAEWRKACGEQKKKLNDTIKSGERACRHVVGEGGTRKKPNQMDKTGEKAKRRNKGG